MTGRSAEASIKGYMFQFLHTIKDILNSDEDAINTIEGIEDLDIENANYEQLVQYKYHEWQTFKNSLVAKPMGLMFNHFINNDKVYRYVLSVHLNDDLPNLNLELIKKIFALKTTQKYIDTNNIIYCSDIEKLKSFLESFKWIRASKYERIEKDIITLIVDIFIVSEDEAKFVYLPNAINKIIELGIKPNNYERKISTLNFIKYLKEKKSISDIAYIRRIYGASEASRLIKNKMKNSAIKKNNSDIIIFINDNKRHELEDMIICIAKKFFYTGNKNDYRPVTFIYNQTPELKKRLITKINKSNEMLVFNDGYEDYSFNSKVFNRSAITTGKPLQGKVNDVNYNFKLISKENFLDNHRKIDFFNSTLISLCDIEEDVRAVFSRIYILKQLENDAIINIIGGIHG